MLTTERRYRMSGSVTTHIDAPPAVVWSLVSDITRMGEWSPETYRAEWLDGAQGPAVGARFRGHNRRPFLQRWSTRPRVRVCDSEREFTFALGSRQHDFVVWRYRFQPAAGGTDLTESVTVRGYALYGLLRPRRRERQLVEGMCHTLARLKQAAERPMTASVSALTERWVSSVGLRTRVIEVGDPSSDEAIVFLHGVPGSANHWDRLLPLVEPFSRGVALDLPGFGHADKPDDWEYSPNAYANFLAGALHTLGIERVHLVMNDLGGIGLFWAAAHPDNFASATLIDSGVASTYRRWHLVGQLYRAPVLGRVAVAAGRVGYRQVMRLYLSQPRRLPRPIADDMRHQYGRGGRNALLRFYRGANPPAWNRVAATLAPLDRPALVVWGAHDRFLRVTQAHEQLRSFPEAEVVVLPDSGHYAHLDDPERVAELVVPFLRAQVRSSASVNAGR